MIRLTFALRRLRHLSRQEFQSYWREKHGPLAAGLAPVLNLRRYVQTHTLDDPLNDEYRKLYGSSEDLFDGIAEVWMNDAESMTSHPEALEAGHVLLEDEKNFIDLSRSALWTATEVPQINPLDERIFAIPGTPILKFVAFLSRKPDVSFEATQLHWRMSHGPMARHFGATLGFRRYIQVHRYDTALSDAMRQQRGSPNPPFYGHAEIWFDRRDAERTSGPEVDEAYRMLLEDDDLFIDRPNSIFYVAKEHVMVDRPLVGYPIPHPPTI